MDDHRVILEVQRHRILYDTTDPFYKDNMRKEQAWNEVSAVLCADPADCKARWRILRDSFVKHVKKASVPNIPPGVAPRDWKYTTSMTFLLPFIQARRPKRRLLPLSDPDSDRAGPPSSLNPSPCPALPAAPSPLWAAPVEEDKPSMSESDRDEIYHFAMSTVPLLLRLGKRQRRRAKLEILQTLDRLEEEEEVQAAARRYYQHQTAPEAGAGVQRAGVQRPPASMQRPPGGALRPSAGVSGSAEPDTDSAEVKEESEEQLGAICVKIEDSSLLQQRQTEQRQEAQPEDLGSEQQFHSETEGQSSDTDNDDDWEPL